MNKFFRIVSVCLLVFLTACGGENDKYSKYTGYWDLEYGERDFRKIMLIKSQDDGLLLLDYNVLSDTNPQGGVKTLVTITKQEGGLSVSSDYVNGGMSVSEDAQTLTLGDKKYKKIAESDLESAIDSYKECDAIREVYWREYKAVSGLGSELIRKRGIVKDSYNSQMIDIPGCPLIR